MFCFNTVSNVHGCVFVLMVRRPTRSTRTDTLFPYTTLFRSLFSAMIDSRRIPKAIAAGGYVEHVQQRQLPDVEGEQQQERTGARIPGSIDASRRLTPERAGGQIGRAHV